MSSTPTSLRKRALQALGYFRQTHKLVDGRPVALTGRGPIRRPDGTRAVPQRWTTCR